MFCLHKFLSAYNRLSNSNREDYNRRKEKRKEGFRQCLQAIA